MARSGGLQLGVRRPARPRSRASRDGRAVGRADRLARGRVTMPPTTDRQSSPARPAGGLSIEQIAAIESPREFRLHPRDQTVPYTADAAGAGQLFSLPLARVF